MSEVEKATSRSLISDAMTAVAAAAAAAAAAVVAAAADPGAVGVGPAANIRDFGAAKGKTRRFSPLSFA